MNRVRSAIAVNTQFILNLLYQSMNQSKHIYIAPCVVNESETRLGVHVYYGQCQNGSVFKLRSKVLISSTDLQLYDSELQAEGELML